MPDHNTTAGAAAPQPTGIRLRRKSALLELSYADGRVFELPAELLRVYSPSADVKGHGKGQEVLQIGKRNVGLTGIEPMGNYAIRLDFDDGHNSGIFSWDYLYRLATQQPRLWQDYLDKLAAAGKHRDALPVGTQVINIVDPSRSA